MFVVFFNFVVVVDVGFLGFFVYFGWGGGVLSFCFSLSFLR